jgi:hypothetical protein
MLQEDEPIAPRRKRRHAPMPEPVALSTAKAAAYLGVSKSLLRKFRGRGADDLLPLGPKWFYATSHMIMYDKVELDRWLNERRAASRPTGAAA